MWLKYKGSVMCMRNKKNKGIVLITTMCLLTIIIMITTLVAAQGKAALQSGTASMQAEEAYMAALSGVEFVRGCLKVDKSFGTDTSSIRSCVHKKNML